MYANTLPTTDYLLTREKLQMETNSRLLIKEIPQLQN